MQIPRVEMALDGPLSAKLHNALNEVWDGSRSQEEGLVKLLKAVDAIILGHLAGGRRRTGATGRKHGK